MLPEEDLIKSRPLLFESRPITRIQKRLSTLPTTAPADLDADFTAFAATLSRLSLLRATNTREITRYAASRAQILSLTAAAREAIAGLRDALADAHRAKTHRLQYDAIAEGILSARGLRPRVEALAGIERLRGEIAELEREREEYKRVWGERRAQFDVIVTQLERMWGQIKEEKEEQERREGMSEDEEEGKGEGKAGGEEGEREEGEEVEEEDEDMVDLVARGGEKMDTS